jgi:hypothetical protein
MTLSEAALALLGAEFQTRAHYPSENHWAALRDVAVTLEAMANGIAEDKVYLSPIDCGVGKSSTALAFARALITSTGPRYLDTGMMVCVNRTREAYKMAAELMDLGKHVVVLTAETAGELDGEDINSAQLLITTQQRVEQAFERDREFRSTPRPFADLDQFYYHCQPRQVRVHDEAFLPGDAINLGRDLIGSLLRPARRLSVPFNAALDDFMDALKSAPKASLINVPDWTLHDGVTVYALLQELAEESRPVGAYQGCDDGVRPDLQMAAKSLFFVAGRSARVWRDNQTGDAVLEYRDTLPPDIRPLVVLDASGRVRQTYRDMEQAGLLKPLRSAVKDYSPLTVHWWQRGGGKASFQAGGDELAKGIAQTIAEKPDQDWLVVHHKTSGRLRDVERGVRRLLPPMTGMVQFCTWGNHLGTNLYVDVANVILAGTLFMSPGHYVALTHLCKAQPMSQGLCDPDDIKLTARGETADGVFQAICRGRVRKSDGDKCQPMDAYVIATPQSGMGEILSEAFPGATVVDWSPLGPSRTKAQLALAYLDAEFEGGSDWIAFGDIKAAIGTPDKKNFRRDVLKKPDWSTGLNARGLVTVTPRGKPHGICRRELAALAAA